MSVCSVILPPAAADRERERERGYLCVGAIYQATKFLAQMSRGQRGKGGGDPASVCQAGLMSLVCFSLWHGLYILAPWLATRTNNPSSLASANLWVTLSASLSLPFSLSEIAYRSSVCVTSLGSIASLAYRVWIETLALRGY